MPQLQSVTCVGVTVNSMRTVPQSQEPSSIAPSSFRPAGLTTFRRPNENTDSSAKRCLSVASLPPTTDGIVSKFQPVGFDAAVRAPFRYEAHTAAYRPRQFSRQARVGQTLDTA